MAFQNKSDRAGDMAVRSGVLAGLEQLQIQHQGARGAVFESGIPQLDDAPERHVEADHVAGFFHGGEEILALPVAGIEGRHRLARRIALNVLPVTFEVFALQFFLELFQYFGHRITPLFDSGLF